MVILPHLIHQRRRLTVLSNPEAFNLVCFVATLIKDSNYFLCGPGTPDVLDARSGYDVHRGDTDVPLSRRLPRLHRRVCHFLSTFYHHAQFVWSMSPSRGVGWTRATPPEQIPPSRIPSRPFPRLLRPGGWRWPCTRPMRSILHH
jgi:hypothetical protein